MRLPQDPTGSLPDASAKAKAETVEDEVLLSGGAVVTVGDTVGISDRFIGHRATCHCGMTGCAARSLAAPHAMIGIHLGSAGMLSAGLHHALHARPCMQQGADQWHAH